MNLLGLNWNIFLFLAKMEFLEFWKFLKTILSQMCFDIV